MRFLLIVLLGTLMSFTNCVTKNKVKEIEKTSELKDVQELKIIDSVSFSESNNDFSEVISSSTSEVLKALNVDFDDLVEITITDSGITFKGKAKGNFNTSEKKEDKKEEREKSESLIEAKKTKVDSKANLKSKIETSQLVKNKEAKSNGLSFGVYASIFLLFCFIIFLSFIGYKFKVVQKLKDFIN